MKPASNLALTKGQPVQDHVEETAFKVKLLNAISDAWASGTVLIVDVGKRDIHPEEKAK